MSVQPTEEADITLLARLEEACSGMWNISESDSPVFPYFSNNAALTGDITTEMITRATQRLWNDKSQEIAGGTRCVESDNMPLDQQLCDAIDVTQFFQTRGGGEESPDECEGDRQWRELGNLIAANMTGLVGYKYGECEITYIIAGRSCTGHLMGILTGSVET